MCIDKTIDVDTSITDGKPDAAPRAEALADPLVSCRNLTKRYGDVLAVDEITFSLAPGTVTGFLGPNGAGKTTTLRMLLGLAEPSGGEALVFGRRYRELEQPIRRVGAVLESTDYHPSRSGRDHLRMLALAAELPLSRVEAVLELVQLTTAASRRVRTYSLGMRQRLGLAAALLGDPELLILDEPMNGLDPGGMEDTRLMIRGLVAEGRTVVLSSHLLDEVEKTCDAIAIVDRGRVVAQGSIEELTGGAETLLVSTGDDLRARALLNGHEVEVVEEGLRVHTHEAALINRRLVEAGIDVHRLEPERISLERRFLELTTRLEAAA